MYELIASIPTAFFLSLVLGLTILQAMMSVYLFMSLRLANKERSDVYRELFGLFKRIEGLTATRRESMLKQYDKILDNLSKRLPPTIASKAGQMIYETESKILTRLAELEPTINENHEMKAKLDELIRTMEGLETTIITLTSDTVQKVMVDARKDLFNDEKFADVSMAA